MMDARKGKAPPNGRADEEPVTPQECLQVLVDAVRKPGPGREALRIRAAASILDWIKHAQVMDLSMRPPPPTTRGRVLTPE